MAKARSKTLPPLVVRYPRRMKHRKTHAVHVTWQGTPPRLGDDAPDVRVRLIMGGAQVVPNEQTMDPDKPRDKAVFAVAPIAKGWFRRERLEIIVDGEKVQEIQLPAKAVTQRKAWFFLLMAILVPWWLTSVMQPMPYELNSKKPFQRHIADNSPVDEARSGIGYLLEQVGLDTESFTEGWNTAIREIGNLYNLVCLSIRLDVFIWDGNEIKLYLPFWTCIGFLFLALVSAFFHRQKWKKRVGKPIRLAILDD